MLDQEFAPRPKAFEGLRRGNFAICGEEFPAAAEKRVDSIMNAMQEAYSKVFKRSFALDKLPRDRQRFLAGLAETTMAHHKACANLGNTSFLYHADANFLAKVQANEQVTSANFQTFTTQILAFLVDVFAPWLVDEIFSTIVMTGPTAYVARETGSYDEDNANSCFYNAGTALTAGFDPSCADCPDECGEANTVGLSVDLELVTVDCTRLAAEYCVPANYHLSSQYNRSLPDRLLELMAITMRRSIQGHLLANLVSAAGDITDWNQTPEAGYYASANPKEWDKTLFDAVTDANNISLKAPDGRRSLDRLIGDVDAMAILEKIAPFQFVDNQPADVISASISQMTEYMGTTKAGRYRCYRALEGMPASTLILTDRRDNDPTSVYGVWIPITNLGTLMHPKTAMVEMGAISLWGNSFLHPDRIQKIRIGA